MNTFFYHLLGAAVYTSSGIAMVYLVAVMLELNKLITNGNVK